MNAGLYGSICSLLAVLILGAPSLLSAAPADQRSELGVPLIRNYTVNDIGEAAHGDPGQVWSILQDRRGVMFFGLSRVILEFDGARQRTS